MAGDGDGAGAAAKLRFVRCPKCMKILVENPSVPVYRCGGCGAVLRAKDRGQQQRKVEEGKKAMNKVEFRDHGDLIEELERSLSTDGVAGEAAGDDEEEALDSHSERLKRPAASSPHDDLIEELEQSLDADGDAASGEDDPPPPPRQQYERCYSALPAVGGVGNDIDGAGDKSHRGALSLDSQEFIAMQQQLIRGAGAGSSSSGDESSSAEQCSAGRRVERLKKMDELRNQLSRRRQPDDLTPAAAGGRPPARCGSFNTECSFCCAAAREADTLSQVSSVKTVLRKKPLVRPLAGAAPFVVCSGCLVLLQMPSDTHLSRRRLNRLKCGECKRLLALGLPAAVSFAGAECPKEGHGDAEDGAGALHRLMGYTSASGILKSRVFEVGREMSGRW